MTDQDPSKSPYAPSDLPKRPEGQHFYGPLEPATLIDGWCYGYITEAPSEAYPEGCTSGDGYAVAPDGSYAGLIWSMDCPWECQSILDVSEERKLRSKQFGVFEVQFPKPIRTIEDLTWNFQRILPELKNAHALWQEEFKSL